MRLKPRFAAIALSLLMTSTAALADIRIGVSMSTFDDNWLTYLREYLSTKAKTEGVTLQFEDARNDVVKQLNQVQSFTSQGVDAIIVNPVDTAATKGINEAAIKAGIPLVYINRKPDDPKLPERAVTVTSDDKEAGRLQAEYIADKLGGKGQVAILLGDLTNNSTQNRTAGFKEVLAKHPNIKIVEEQTGLWQRDKGMDLTSNWLLAGKQIDAVLSNNDEMGIGAAMALRQAGKKDVLVGGVDGTPDGLASIKRGLLTVSVFQDARGQAEGSLEAAVKLINKQPVEKNILIPFRLITVDNLAQFQALTKQ
ncbi:sugar ABC transporter substrate-binding protein [Pseudomonas sp. LJDD11]|uniref:sugar ABC transporter substrate-binding protein n=1 Tax=unclassified Pseudomonas TaxID=196821 RepID=UPI0004F7C93D|nr:MULTISPECIES: sugar ABC transporter substrate-binding protein [unclassified Pseudomonas]MCO8163005.1 sugar ABC transporter substrate-binding protein [Pseudomonas sp. 21LCFQ010]MCQ9425051.1 sugar ABC transporter substrate-binding protein [Pseudomonas sp. LJDD11]BAP41128.1 periplasmic substrate-binding protein of sugar ABC transporter [Pseudomonas sp. StFLB209]